MATVTVYGAERMKEIEDETIVDAEIVGNNLVLTTRAGQDIVAGEVTSASITLSDDETLADESVTEAPTERAVKVYVDGAVAGLEPPEALTVTSNDTSLVPVATAGNVATIDVGNLAKRLTVKNITANYSALLADQEKLITVSGGGSAITVTLPQNSAVAFPVGAQLHFAYISGTSLTFAAGTGATVTKPTSKTLLALEVGVVITAIKISTNGWILVGALGNA